jgi:tetratricopeptide (TPR) repeat protein
LGTLQSSINQNLLSRYNEITKLIIRKGLFDTFSVIDLGYFVLNISVSSKELVNLRTENLKLAIQHSKDFAITGTYYYNIGIIERGLSNIDEAIFSYFKARKYLPEYEKRGYWWRELAGLLFIKRHFKLAESFYSKSIELIEDDFEKRDMRLEQIQPNQESIVYALIGDCLLFQGKFSKAAGWFDKFLESQNSNSSEWHLKKIITGVLIKLRLDDKKIEREKSIELCENALGQKDIKLQISALTEAIEFDPTNALAWFNLGIAKDKDEELEDAFYCFLISGLLQEGDKEAQFNALLISIIQQEYELFSLILNFLIEKYGEFVANDLSDYIFAKPIPLNGKKRIIEAITSLIQNPERLTP